MRKLMCLILLVSFTASFAEENEFTILLKNNKIVKGRFLKIRGNSVKFRKPPYTRPSDVEIKLSDVRIILSSDNRIVYPVKTELTTKLDEMSERQFQAYLFQKQLEESQKLRQEVRGVKKATNGIFITILGGYIIVVIAILAVQ